MAEGGKDIVAVKQAHRATRATCWNLMVLNQVAIKVQNQYALRQFITNIFGNTGRAGLLANFNE